MWLIWEDHLLILNRPQTFQYNVPHTEPCGTVQALELVFWIHLDILEKYLRRFEIYFCHKKQEKLSDLTDLPNKQSFAWQY